MNILYPKKITSYINGREVLRERSELIAKFDPATGKAAASVSVASRTEVEEAVKTAEAAQVEFEKIPVLKRAQILRDGALLLKTRKAELAELSAFECGKPGKAALGEIDAAFECGMFFAGEGQRYFGEVLPSGNPARTVQLVREPIGVGALITSFNNPIAGAAWKVFPALLCGNAVILKAHEYAPYSPVLFAKILEEAGLPKGLLNVIEGGAETGAAIVANRAIKFVSVTGSAATGAKIIAVTAERLAKVSVEAGGKNPFVVLADADLKTALEMATLGAFVDAGERCAATTRIIVEAPVYEEFRKLFLEKAAALKVGVTDDSDFGAIISRERRDVILGMVNAALKRDKKIKVLLGRENLSKKSSDGGYFISPIVLENVSPRNELSRREIFGPVVILYKAKDFAEALKLANDSDFKLASAVHTKSLDKASAFVRGMKVGVVRVNGPTHGSEAHMPFGGVGLSGNGSREPGAKALDFYSEWKQVSFDIGGGI